MTTSRCSEETRKRILSILTDISMFPRRVVPVHVTAGSITYYRQLSAMLRGPRLATTQSTASSAAMLRGPRPATTQSAVHTMCHYVSLRHSLIVLSFSSAADAMMFSVG